MQSKTHLFVSSMLMATSSGGAMALGARVRVVGRAEARKESGVESSRSSVRASCLSACSMEPMGQSYRLSETQVYLDSLCVCVCVCVMRSCESTTRA